MSFMTDEIARQPGAWREATAAAAGAAAAGLPRPGERAAVVGCGTSWYIAEAYARLREQRGSGETDAFAASEFPVQRGYDRLIVISRSGTTTEILDLLARLRGRCPTVAITASPDTRIGTAADHIIDLSFADERSVVQTVSATSALTLLRASLGEATEVLADAAERVLAEPIPPEWIAAEQITFLGRGWVHGIAREAALKMRETTQGWTEAYPSMEYRHGPIAIAAPGRLVWQLGPDAGRLREDVRQAGALFVNHPDDPQVDLVRVHRLAAAVARLKRLDPDRPRNLTRSVVLGS